MLRYLLFIFLWLFLPGLPVFAQSVSVHAEQPAFKEPAHPASSALAACAALSLYLDSDGIVWAWGRVSLPGMEQSSVPVPVMTDGAGVAAGLRSAFVLRKDGTLWAWGENYGKRLALPGRANPTENTYAVPAKIMDGVQDVRAAFGGGVALLRNNTLWQWGELPWSKRDESSLPFEVAKNVSQVRLGSRHAIFLDPQGQLWAWGNNTSGALGLGYSNWGERAPKKLPLTTLYKRGNIIDFACDYSKSLAVLSDGSVWFWGNDEKKLLGEGEQILIPEEIWGVEHVTKAGFLSQNGFLFLKRDKSLWVMGNNSDGLGIPRNGRGILDEPEKVEDGVADFVSAFTATHGSYAIFVKEDGSLWSWGNNENGQLGDGSKENRELPVPVSFPASAKALYDPPLEAVSQ